MTSVTDTVHLTVNGEARELRGGATLDGLVASLTGVTGVTGAPSGVAAAVNETVVPRGRWHDTVLSDGDRVEILTAVQGG